MTLTRIKSKNRDAGHQTHFLMYIHEQISAFSAGLSACMSKGVGWFNIEGPTLITPDRDYNHLVIIYFHPTCAYPAINKPHS
jgi:hypothetical protein